MSEPVVYLVKDFQDLPFDVSKHSEALKSFAALNLLPQSLKPALRVRDLVFIRIPSCKFRIGVTSSPDMQEGRESSEGSIAFEVIYQADNPLEAKQVRGEVERYFLRHYPGRTLSSAKEAEERILTGNYVYVTCYTPNE